MDLRIYGMDLNIMGYGFKVRIGYGFKDIWYMDLNIVGHAWFKDRIGHGFKVRIGYGFKVRIGYGFKVRIGYGLR